MFANNLNSARAVAADHEKNLHEENKLLQEKNFDRDLNIRMLNELHIQNIQLEKQNKEIKNNLLKSEKYNKVMLIIAIASFVMTVVSAIAAVIAALK